MSRWSSIAMLLGVSIAACAPGASGGELYVVAVGIETYQKAGLERVGSAETDAGDFQEYVKARWKINAHVTLLSGPNANKYGIENALYINLTKAGRDDSVYLFLSARGSTATHTHAGYILPYEAQADNGPGNGIPLTYFGAILQGRQQPSGPVYLFADLCRQPASSQPNWIQRSLEDLARQNDSVRGILATTPDHRSTDGVFAKALLDSMRQPNIDPERQYDLFFLEVKKRARPQDPDKLPVRSPKQITLNRPAFHRYPGEIAMLGSPIPLLFAMQAPDASGRLRDRFREALADRKLTGAGEAFDLFQALKPLESPAAADEDAAALLTALENSAQQVVADYGSGEQFPNDPMKLNAARFLQAADYFEHASTLERRERKDEIDSRALFCRGRAKLFDGTGQDIAGAATLLTGAVQRHPAFPEPFNGLGIVHLARAKSAGAAQPQTVAAEFSEAVSQFTKATEAAPMWAYARHNLALTYAETGDFRRAENEYTRAIRQTPFHPYLQYNLALLLQNENRLREAERQYKAAEDVFKKLIGKHTAAQADDSRLGAAAGPDSRYYQEQSALEARIVRALKENLAETYNALGTLRENRRDPKGAGLYYQAALNNADSNETRHNLASLDVSLGRDDAAKALWTQNLSRDRKHLPSLMGLARVYRAENRPGEAIAYYERVLAIDAGQIAAREDLALSLSDAGRVGEAAGQLEEAIRRQQRARSSPFANAALHKELGDLYWRQTRPVDACAQYRFARRAQQAGFGNAAGLKEGLRRCPAN